MNIGLDGNEANVTNRVGSGVYALNLLKEFSKIKKHNFTVYLKDKPLSILPITSKNFKYKIFGPKKLWTQIALSAQLTIGTKFDVFFSLGHYGPRFTKVPYVVTIHDLSYLRYPQLFKKEDLYQLKNWSKYSIEKSAHIIAVSNSTKGDIVENYNIPASKISVTYEGYDESFKPSSKKKVGLVAKKYKIEGDYIIFVGTIQPRKNIERLIEAFSKVILNSQFSNFKLAVVGKKGWHYDAILDKSKKLGIENSVIFTGFVPENDLPALISGACVYVLPSLWEGFGIPVIEAQASGIPTVVSNTSSLPEVVENSGILIDPLSVKSISGGIIKALDNATNRALVERGFENIKRFSWKKCADETIQILEKVASRHH